MNSKEPCRNNLSYRCAVSDDADKIRIAVVGQRGCGKSTVVNALSQDIVVPENPMMAASIPTYIAKSAAEGDSESVIIVSEADKNPMKALTRKEFLTYCYNDEDQGSDVGRLRLKDDRYAVVHAEKGKLFEKGAVILETLASVPSPIYNRQTHAMLKDNVDFLIYIVGSNVLDTADIAFLQCYVLGYTPKEDEVEKWHHDVEEPIITPDKLIILGNDKTGIIRAGFVNSVKRIFNSKDCGLSENDIENFCENNVWVANALYGRLSSAGIYDHVGNAPIGSSDEYFDDVNRFQKMQKRTMNAIEDGTLDVKEWDEFFEHICQMCTRLSEKKRYEKINNCFNDIKDKLADILQDVENIQKDIALNMREI